MCYFDSCYRLSLGLIMLVGLYETKTGRYAELHSYQEPRVDDDGFPDGWNEIWEVYTFENEHSPDFASRTFVAEVARDLFLKMNGYKEIVK